MDFQLRSAGTYIAVELSGAPLEADIRAMLVELLQRSREANLLAALVEVRLAFGLDPVASKDLVLALPAMGFAPEFRIAVLLLDDAARNAARFAENVAFNRGLAVRVFDERAKALEWLCA